MSTPMLAIGDVELRRRLRPTAWTVWTAVLEHAVLREDGSWFAAVSLRSLAGELDLAKDTIASAMQRLAAYNLVERRRQDHVAGRFVAGGYVVHRPAPMACTTTNTIDPTASTSVGVPLRPFDPTVPANGRPTPTDLASPPLNEPDPTATTTDLTGPFPSRPDFPPTTSLTQLSFLTGL